MFDIVDIVLKAVSFLFCVLLFFEILFAYIAFKTFGDFWTSGYFLENVGNLRIQGRMQIFVLGALFHQKRMFLIGFSSWECRNRA